MKQTGTKILTVEADIRLKATFEVEGTPERLAEIKRLVERGDYIADYESGFPTIRLQEDDGKPVAELIHYETLDHMTSLDSPVIIELEAEEEGQS